MIFFISYWNNSDLGPAKDRYNEILKTITKNKKKIIITSTTSKDIKFYKKINNRILIKRFNIFKLLNFINFILITQFVLIGYSKQIKCVIVTSSKLFSLLPVVILKKLSNHQFYLIYDIRDYFSKNIYLLTKNKFLFNLVKTLEKFIISNADFLTTPNIFVHHQFNIDINYLPNKIIKNKHNGLYNFKIKKIIYAGNYSYFQFANVELYTLIKNNKKINFDFYVWGLFRDKLIELKKKFNITNMTILNPISKRLLNKKYKDYDAALCTLNKKYKQRQLPSKINTIANYKLFLIHNFNKNTYVFKHIKKYQINNIHFKDVSSNKIYKYKKKKITIIILIILIIFLIKNLLHKL